MAPNVSGLMPKMMVGMLTLFDKFWQDFYRIYLGWQIILIGFPRGPSIVPSVAIVSRSF